MDEVYEKIWKLAKPYYKKGRAYDIDQIEWMLRIGEPIAEEIGADKRILLPLIILHDIGYSAVNQSNPDIKDKSTKIIHMKAGAEIAEKILKECRYDSKLSSLIVYYVSVHDNWVLNDDKPFKSSLEMALFNDLDFLYAQSSIEQFRYCADSMGMKVEEMYYFWMDDEKLERRPFCCRQTRGLFSRLMEERRKELDENIC